MQRFVLERVVLGPSMDDVGEFVDILSDGRLEMGTGRSSSPYQLEAFGVDVRTSREQWEEGIKLLPQLWDSQDFSYQGVFYSWEDKVTVLPKPLQKPHPPLWVACTQPDTCALAGSKGIGLLCPAIAPPETFAAHIKSYKDAVANPVDQIGAFKNDQIGMFTVTFCHDDEEAAQNLGGPAGLWYVQTVARIYQDDWRGVPLDQVPDSYRYHAEARRRGRGANTAMGIFIESEDQEKLWRTLVENGAFCVGDPESVKKKVEGYRDAGGDRLVSVMQVADLRHEDLMRSIELMGTKVIPHIRALEAAEAAGAVG